MSGRHKREEKEGESEKKIANDCYQNIKLDADYAFI